jgi:hypothetical protein
MDGYQRVEGTGHSVVRITPTSIFLEGAYFRLSSSLLAQPPDPVDSAAQAVATLPVETKV